ncbi:MAG: LysR substrate-binding domain-containing protein [Umezawaea sp.]
MDVDLRKLRYFVAVAEELHFGRAADALRIAQPVLSRQIRALEEELKARLFLRDKRGTELTPAGAQLLADARPLLAGAGALRRRVGRAARGADRFTVGFMPGLVVSASIRVLASRHPELSVDVVRTGRHDQTDVVHDGRVDVSFVRLPVDRRGLQVRPLTTEPRVVVLPVGHRLAAEESVAIADLADEHLVQDPDAVPEWRDVATGVRAGSRRAHAGIRTVEEELGHVASGTGVVVLPLSVATFHTRPDLTHVPIGDIGPNHVCLVWDASRRSPLIHEFAAIAEEHHRTPVTG